MLECRLRSISGGIGHNRVQIAPNWLKNVSQPIWLPPVQRLCLRAVDVVLVGSILTRLPGSLTCIAGTREPIKIVGFVCCSHALLCVLLGSGKPHTQVILCTCNNNRTNCSQQFTAAASDCVMMMSFVTSKKVEQCGRPLTRQFSCYSHIPTILPPPHPLTHTHTILLVI